MSSKDQKNGLYQTWKNIPLWKKIMTGMVLGLATGFAMGPDAVMFKPLGDLFLNAIKMLIVPLVFCSLVSGVTSMNDSSKMGRVALKSIALYLTTGAVAITVGLLIGNFFAPGEGLNLVAPAVGEVKESASMIDTLVATIPANPIMSMAKGEILQIIVFALFVGIAISTLGKKAEPMQKLIESGAEIMYQLTGIVMSFAPYGIFGLMAAVAGQNGIEVLLPLAKVIGSVYFGCAFLIYGLYSIFLKANGLSPRKFLKATMNVQTVAFSTSSSSGTLPVSLQTGEKKLGLSKSICSFVMPLGATVNMNGTALYQGVCALFIAQAYGIDLSMADYVTIIFTSTLAAVGTAGVPGAGLIMLSLVLSSVGLPIEGVALIAAIDRILDMARTWVNVQGDVMVSTVIAKTEGELDKTIFDDEKAGESLKPQVATA
ncbi:dicarboxylate/amino acid:cation symporter [Endozoicomonas arenosclerae]|uniref:dicarboxylate/amino acid:cation symporter n=1 Tax=Endozoicomonas arenosclerae TaxID=1633495 RepID=UPI000783551F|nr:dicarboxylate/amino acid:cation symporter [Endozoicomonas arenosclerae]